MIPHSELAIFERSGHSPQVEEREAFTRRLAASHAGTTLTPPLSLPREGEGAD